MDDLLLQKYVRNEASEKEIIRVLDWLDADPANQRYLDELDFILNADTLFKSALPRKKTTPRRKKILLWAASGAAALLVCAGMSYWFANEIVDGRNQQNHMSISAPYGQRISVTLGDGTLVWLNSGTTIEYPSVFPKRQRRVRVSGEAMFEVEHDPHRPFVVETFACEAEVLGTRFNICADAETSYFTAALFEGRLKVSNLGRENESVIMAPDEIVELVNGHLMLNRIAAPEEFLWVDGIVALDNAGFREVMSKFEKSFGVRIEIETEQIPAIRYKGKIRVSDGVDYALRMLQLTSEFYYEKNSETNTIHIK